MIKGNLLELNDLKHLNLIYAIKKQKIKTK